MIYFIQAIDGGAIKIGTTTDLDARMKQLEVHYGCTLALLATIDGGYEEEAAIHERFAHLRFKRSGPLGRQPEQFRPGPDLMEFIGRPLLAVANLDSVEMMPSSNKGKPVAFQIRASLEYKVAVEELAEYDGKSMALLADHALRIYARTINYPKAIPKR